MDKKNRLEFIENIIQRDKAITINKLFPLIPYCEKTLRRDISELKAITSYTHRGKFITLPNIPEFDRNGIWFNTDIGFTKYKNSLELISFSAGKKSNFSDFIFFTLRFDFQYCSPLKPRKLMIIF